MRKIILVLAALMLILNAAQAEAPKVTGYVMEGFDGDNSGHDWSTHLFFTRMQERTGISFQFNQYTDYGKWTARKSEMLAGGSLPDVLFKASLTPRETEQMHEAGILIDLKPYLEQYAPDLWKLLQEHPDWEKAITLEDGSIPALPNLNPLQNNLGMWINSAWLKTLNLKTPRTADELTEVLRAFRDQDPNRNGKADEVPLAFLSMWELRFLAHAFGIIDNDYYVTAAEGGVTSSLNTEENRRFLEWLHMLWEERLLDHQGFSLADTMRQSTDSKADITYGVILSVSPIMVISSAHMDQYSLLMPLEYEGKQVYRDLLGDVVRGTFALTRACREPENMIAWVNWLYTEEGSRLMQAGQENTEYFWNEDGYWEWMADLATVAGQVLQTAVISEGGTAPGYTSPDFQMAYADESARNSIIQQNDLKQYSRMPFPYVNLTEEDARLITELQAKIAPYAEQTMAEFVTGDLSLNDQTWGGFCAKLEEYGLPRMTEIWQKYITE